MALIFSPSVRSAFAFHVLGYEPNALFKNQTKILFYSGVQPTVSTFVTNFNAAYQDNGSACLGQATTIGWTRNQNSWAITTFPGPITPRLNGTVTFAAIFTNSQSTSGAISSASQFMLVPVTDTASNGVIRFTSTTFSTSTPMSIIDGGFSIL